MLQQRRGCLQESGNLTVFQPELTQRIAVDGMKLLTGVGVRQKDPEGIAFIFAYNADDLISIFVDLPAIPWLVEVAINVEQREGDRVSNRPSQHSREALRDDADLGFCVVFLLREEATVRQREQLLMEGIEIFHVCRVTHAAGVIF